MFSIRKYSEKRVNRVKDLLDCSPYLTFSLPNKKNEFMLSENIYPKEQAKRYCELFIELTQIPADAMVILESEIQVTVPSKNGKARETTAKIANIKILLDKLPKDLLITLKVNKQQKLEELEKFINQINYHPIPGEWTIENNALCLVSKSLHAEMLSDFEIENGLKESLADYYSGFGKNFKLENIFDPDEMQLYKEQYARKKTYHSPANSCALPLSPLYLLLIKLHKVTSKLQNEYKQEIDVDFTMDSKNLMGKGGFASVYAGALTNKHRDKVAIKQSTANDAKSYKSLQHEKELYEFLARSHNNNHSENNSSNSSSAQNQAGLQNIIKYYGYEDSGLNVGFKLILEFADDALHHVIFKTQLSMKNKFSLMVDIMNGMDYLHAAGIIYRDMKPDNILVFQTKHGWVGKLADFGISSCTNDYFGGTPTYFAPEVLQKICQNLPSDIYSVGLTYYEIVAGHRAFVAKDEQSIQQHIVVERKRFDMPKDCPKKLSILINSLWSHNAADRPTANQALIALHKISADDLLDVPNGQKKKKTQ